MPSAIVTRNVVLNAFCSFLLCWSPFARGEDSATQNSLEIVAKIDGPIVTGVAVSRRGRVFVTFPRWSDPVTGLIAEVIDGKLSTFPDDDAFSPNTPVKDRLISIQNAVFDSQDRLWALDSGSTNEGPVETDGAKLVSYDITSRIATDKISFSESVVHKDSYLNDVRFDLRRGKAGFAFITDSAPKGRNAIIVVDLSTGESWRRLDGQRSVRPQPGFLPLIGGIPLMVREPGQHPAPLSVGCDGIALSPDGTLLYYSPLSGHKLYSVSVDALVDRKLNDQAVSATVTDLGDKTTASDGIIFDNRNRLYLTSYEHNAIYRRNADGTIETLIKDSRLQWPDTLAISRDQYLYVTANQLNLMPRFHDGKDLRHKPWYVFRLKIDAGPTNR